MISWALALMLSVGPAPEQHTVHVQVVLDDCVGQEPISLEPQLALEFGPPIMVSVETAQLPAAPGASGAGATVSRVEVDCDGGGLTLALDDPLTDKTMQRTLGLEPGGGDWGRRALALAIVEFVRASWLELELINEARFDEPAPALPLASPPPAPLIRQARIAAARPPRTWTLSLGPRIEILAASGSIHGGGQLRLLHQPRRVLAWTLAASAGHGRHQIPVGTLGVTLAGLAPALLATLQRRSFSVAGGLGAKIGLADIRGSPSPGSEFVGEHFTRAYGGAFALGRFTLELRAHMRLAAELEAGVVTRPVTATAAGEPVFSLSGPWIACALELGFTWPR